jgi:exopolysaccharide biosynthesis polyprenyl glycosylphosphotransferase
MLRRDKQFLTQILQLKDAALFASALWVAHQFRAEWFLPYFEKGEIESFTSFAWLYLVIIPISPFILELQGYYQRPLFCPRHVTAWMLLKACTLMTFVVIVSMFLFKLTLARTVIMLFGPVSFALLFLSEELMRKIVRSRYAQTQLRKRVVLVGSPEDTLRLRKDLVTAGTDALDVVGELDINESGVKELVALLHKESPNSVIINAKHTFFGQIEKAVLACEQEGVEAWLVADFFKTQISRTSLDELHGRPVLVFRSAPEVSWQGIAKQTLDVIGAAILLVAFSWLFLLIAAAIRATTKGPIFFRQERCGLNGRPFTMLKFRSMVTNAEQLQAELNALNEMAGPVFKVSNDPRITSVGRLLRRFSLDELPQLFNVLRGEMSLVGPRPLPVYEVERFDDPSHRRRLSVKPGLTCLWQVSGRNNVSNFKEWVRLDLEYIDNWSIWLDLKILLRTIPVVLTGNGAK